MTGKVEIVNIALARLGESPIQSFEEGSVPANTARLVYDAARRSTLRDYNWNFALTTATLARLDEKPDDFHFAFALPADCLRAVRLRRPGVPDFREAASPHFVLRGGRLFSREPKALLEYVRDVTNEADFDSKFIEAFSYKLASELAMSVKGSTDLMASYSNAYQALVNRAATESAWEEKEQKPANPYLDARF